MLRSPFVLDHVNYFNVTLLLRCSLVKCCKTKGIILQLYVIEVSVFFICYTACQGFTPRMLLQSNREIDSVV